MVTLWQKMIHLLGTFMATSRAFVMKCGAETLDSYGSPLANHNSCNFSTHVVWECASHPNKPTVAQYIPIQQISRYISETVFPGDEQLPNKYGRRWDHVLPELNPDKGPATEWANLKEATGRPNTDHIWFHWGNKVVSCAQDLWIFPQEVKKRASLSHFRSARQMARVACKVGVFA